MARFIHKVSGVRVNVAEGKVLGHEWEPAEKPKPSVKAESKKNEK